MNKIIRILITVIIISFLAIGCFSVLPGSNNENTNPPIHHEPTEYTYSVKEVTGSTVQDFEIDYITTNPYINDYYDYISSESLSLSLIQTGGDIKLQTNYSEGWSYLTLTLHWNGSSWTNSATLYAFGNNYLGNYAYSLDLDTDASGVIQKITFNLNSKQDYYKYNSSSTIRIGVLYMHFTATLDSILPGQSPGGPFPTKTPVSPTPPPSS